MLGTFRRPVGPRFFFVSLLLALLGLALLTSVRVVPVGHALVVFNTVTRSFHLAHQGINLVVPFICATELYDLRRHEYTMSAAMGEGRRSNVDDSLWSPTREGLQVGIDLTVWHRLDPARVIEVHQRIGPDYEEKILRPAVRSVIRLVISEYAVMDVQGRGKAIETVSAALRDNPDYVRYLYVDKLSDKIAVIVSDQNTIMDLKGVLDAHGR
jgi:regulator of protease activity HflC (stomatin/prohibitin superfamily)